MIFETSSLHFGSFDLHGLRVFGELRLSAAQSRLRLRIEDKPARLDAPSVVYGQLHDFSFVSCIDCVGGSTPDTRSDSQGHHSYSWDLFPHFALIGDRHFNPAIDKIIGVWFSVSDASLIFDDFDSYGVLYESPMSISELIPKSVGDRQVPHGPAPKLAYFAGRSNVLDVAVSEGRIEVRHWPIYEMSSSEGIRLGSNLKLGIRFSTPKDISSCLSAVSKLTQFLSLVAGRSQGVSNVQVQTNGATEKVRPLLLHWSFAPSEVKTVEDQDKPSFWDMPLDAIRRPDEFASSLSSWWEASLDQGLARARLHSCRARGMHFDVDRLVAAANMFDLRVTSVETEIPAELAQVCKESVMALMKLPKTDDRDSAIMALKRVGAPSLRKKVFARATVVKLRFVLDDLDEVLRLAIQSRNYFVHGGGDKFNYAAVEPYTAFLTESLEFVFAAAELIECGWDGAAWKRKPHTASHWFSRYLSGYSGYARDLLLACGKMPKIELIP